MKAGQYNGIRLRATEILFEISRKSRNIQYGPLAMDLSRKATELVSRIIKMQLGQFQPLNSRAKYNSLHHSIGEMVCFRLIGTESLARIHRSVIIACQSNCLLTCPYHGQNTIITVLSPGPVE